ncbi:HET-domain-containing protein [Hypoxylon sp. FL0543]|nr:HET-domain-containing protein [Hypoxylon sp. FL0543]
MAYPDAEMSSTYRDLITAIAPTLNLSNVVNVAPSRPCAVCARVVPDRSKIKNHNIQTDYELFDTFPDFPVLKASARAGCALCRLFRKTIRSSWAVALRPMEQAGLGTLSTEDGVWDALFDMDWDRKVRIFHAHFYLSTRTISRGHGEPVEFIQKLIIKFGPANLPTEETGWLYRRQIYQEVEFKVFDSADVCEVGDSDDSFATRYPPDGHALSERNIALMKKWIFACKNNHAACQLGESIDWLPTRLLQISKSGRLKVRLVDTGSHFSKNSGIPVQFMALSHMWGDVTHSPPLRTLKSNYEFMLEGIRMSDLPQNFVDALLVCRELGLEYVWIDSLCIIQDSPEDWKREAVTMHLVYKYAQVTIVAAGAQSSREGFLVRNTRMTPAVKISYSPEHAHRSMILYPSNEESRPDFEYEDTPWNTRGWTFQERYLSTRLIYFCKNMLHFECRTCTHSEEGESATFIDSNKGLWPRTRLPAETWFKIWLDMVMKYTKRKLTYDGDKLIAVQSVANEMKEHVPGPYIEFAGVWQANIHKELLWSPWDGIPTYRDKYRAPSWSWASLDGGITTSMSTDSNRRPRRRGYGEALEVIRFNEGVLPEIVVRAHTRCILSIVRLDSNDLFDVVDIGGYPYNLLTDEPVSSDDSKEPAVFAQGRLDRDNRDHLLEEQADFMYLHVCDYQQPTGLILKKHTPEINGDKLSKEVWVRVGTARVFRDLSPQSIISKGFEGQDMREVIMV